LDAIRKGFPGAQRRGYAASIVACPPCAGLGRPGASATLSTCTTVGARCTVRQRRPRGDPKLARGAGTLIARACPARPPPPR
jgi:hypothetical protein